MNLSNTWVRFHRYEVHGVRDGADSAEVVPDDEADLWCLYGFVAAANGGEFAVCIGDYATQEAAKFALDLIVNE